MNHREEVLKSLNPDFTSSIDLAYDFYRGRHEKLGSVIFYLRGLGWEIETITDGTSLGRGYVISQRHFDLIREVYKHNQERPVGVAMTPGSFVKAIINRSAHGYTVSLEGDGERR